MDCAHFWRGAAAMPSGSLDVVAGLPLGMALLGTDLAAAAGLGHVFILNRWVFGTKLSRVMYSTGAVGVNCRGSAGRVLCADAGFGGVLVPQLRKEVDDVAFGYGAYLD